MFQRYEIVIDYEQRLRLPPPLTIISYLIMIFKWFCKKSYSIFDYENNRLLNVNIKIILIWVAYNSHKILIFKFDFQRRKSLLIEDNRRSFIENHKQNEKDSYKIFGKINKFSSSNTFSSKKQIDHSLYWKIVVQDYVKKLDSENLEKDSNKQQAIG